MARTAVELPDPLENAGGGAANSADDLLAQLAGDEGDRLMSEADAGEPAPQNVDRALAGDEAGTLVDEPPKSVNYAPAQPTSADDLFDENDLELLTGGQAAKVQVGAAQTHAPVAEESVEDSIARRAEELIAQARLEAVEAETDSPATAAAAGAAPLSAADALAAEMEADERAHSAALRRMAGDDPAPAAMPATTSHSGETATEATTIDESTVDMTPGEPDSAEERVPLLVRVLELINAPMAGLSVGVREAMGKVAIVTAVNAVAILAYVLISRRH